MKDTKFDVQIKIDVRVLPRSYPDNSLEKIQWNGIENKMAWEARLLAKAFEEYFEGKVMEELHFLPKGLI